jgi:tetratricopeptide (TPR) repeat protein
MLARLQDRSMYRGVEDDDRKSALATQLHALGMFEAAFDSQSPLAIADQIDALGLEMYAGASVQIRLLVALHRGDMQAAKAWQVRMESLSLQSGAGRQTEIWILGYLIGPHALLGDIIGLKRIADRLALMVVDNPGYRVLLFIALGAYYRARGQIAEAKSALERALQLAPRGQHAFWAVAICHYIDALVASGEYAHALELARESFETGSDELGEPDFMHTVLPSLALANAHLGRCADAASQLELAIERAEREHLPVVRICALHEARARVAIVSGDRAAFDHHACEASRRYRALNNSLLVARHFLLLDEAVQRGLIPPSEGAHPEPGQIAAPTPTVDLASDATEITLPQTLQALLDL